MLPNGKQAVCKSGLLQLTVVAHIKNNSVFIWFSLSHLTAWNANGAARWIR